MPRYKHQTAIDLLTEARRYARSHPDEAIRLCEEGKRYISGNELAIDSIHGFSRVCLNLLIGQRSVLSSPDVFASYITGAIHELQCLGWEHP